MLEKGRRFRIFNASITQIKMHNLSVLYTAYLQIWAKEIVFTCRKLIEMQT